MPRLTHAALCGSQCHPRALERLDFLALVSARLEVNRPLLLEAAKQDPPDSPKSKGSNRSTSVAADGRAASAQHDRSI
jgi:hypothetical protein